MKNTKSTSRKAAAQIEVTAAERNVLTAPEARIFKLVRKNPRKEGSHGFNSWNAITRNGITYAKYLANGGRNRDLRHDILLGRIRVEMPA